MGIWGLFTLKKKGIINQNHTLSVLWKLILKMKSQEKKFELWRETGFRQGSGFNESARLVGLPQSVRLGGGRVHLDGRY